MTSQDLRLRGRRFNTLSAAIGSSGRGVSAPRRPATCLLYTSDAADE